MRDDSDRPSAPCEIPTNGTIESIVRLDCALVAKHLLSWSCGEDLPFAVARHAFSPTNRSAIALSEPCLNLHAVADAARPGTSGRITEPPIISPGARGRRSPMRRRPREACSAYGCRAPQPRLRNSHRSFFRVNVTMRAPGGFARFFAAPPTWWLVPEMRPVRHLVGVT